MNSTDKPVIKKHFSLNNGQLVFLIVIAILLIDQITKFWVKLHFYLGEGVEVFPWFKIEFVQNPGMAFGWTVGSKLFLTLFRIVFSAAIVYAVAKLGKAQLKRGFMVCVALVLAGAIGNIIDCMFYGLIFNNPMPPEVATFLPADGGYAGFLHGQVVDMLYFPLFSFDWPQWMPFVGGEHSIFFSPVFNIADTAISIGILCIIFFYSKQLNVAAEFLSKKKESKESKDS